ncbi:hypothetical protein G6F65_022656 [Rhizopus arrhizus]|nr:hypothetical protein G6F31_020778 [Rhizopus arrhizus]KAG1243066.1 hypothetical protein G6F65_022656 [Rhizopus arrhizus]
MEFWDILSFMAARGVAVTGGTGSGVVGGRVCGAHHDADVAAGDDLPTADLGGLAGLDDAAHADQAVGHHHLARTAAVADAGGLKQLVHFDIGAAVGKREFNDGHGGIAQIQV